MAKYFMIIFCGLSLSQKNAQCQDLRVVDSLHSVLMTKSGGERFPTLYELAFQFIGVDNMKALECIEEAERAAMLSGDSLWIVKSIRVKGQTFLLLERTAEAIDAFQVAEPIAARNRFTNEEYLIESSLVSIDIFVGAYAKALRSFAKLLTMVKLLDNKEELATTLNKIGLTYYKLQDYKKALAYYEMALHEAEAVDGRLFGLVSANLGLCYAHMGDFAKATVHAETSLNKCGPSCNDAAMRNIEYTFAVIAIGENRMKDAEAHLLRSLDFARKTNDSRFQLDNMNLLADLYLQRNAFKKAEDILVDAESLIKRGTPFNLEKIKIYSRLFELYLAIRNYKKASHYQSKYITLKDSVYNDDLTTSLMRAEASFYQRENEAKLFAQQQMIMLHRQVIKAQRWLTLLSCTVAILSITVVLFLYKNYKKKETINNLLDLKVKERTKDLEASQHEMLSAIKQQGLIVARASAGMREKINRLKGLCSIAHAEVSDPVARAYVNNIADASLQIESYLQAVLEEQRSTVSRGKKETPYDKIIGYLA